MKIAHYSTYDSSGGAAENAYRIHQSLVERGHDSRLIVKCKTRSDSSIHQSSKRKFLARSIRRVINSFWKTFLPKSTYVFNYNIKSDIDRRSIFKFPRQEVDIIFLHWITDFLTTEDIRSIYDYYRSPIVWFLCDFEPFTGGCHFPSGCENFTARCGRCPQLNSNKQRDWSRKTLNRKKKSLADLPITFVNGASQILDQARKSSLFQDSRTQLIPGCFDQKIFRPIERAAAREVLGIDKDKKIILIGGAYLDDKRKGIPLALQALNHLAENLNGSNNFRSEDILVLIIGNISNKKSLSLTLPYRTYGYVKEDILLALMYQAANVFLCTSLEDLGPGMAVESILCGTPIVAFDAGICKDLVFNKINGAVAEKGNVDMLAKHLLTVLSREYSLEEQQQIHRSVAKDFSMERAVIAYEKLFAELKNLHSETMR